MGLGIFQRKKSCQVPRRNTDLGCHTLTTQCRVGQLLEDALLGGQQVRSAQRIDSTIAHLARNDIAQQLKDVVLIAVCALAQGLLKKNAGSLTQCAQEQTLGAGMCADLQCTIKAAQAVGREHVLGDVEDELMHRTGKAKQIGLVGAIHHQLSRLQ
ncbi:hypothetical protein FQZ97_973350 [compost metagenome]